MCRPPKVLRVPIMLTLEAVYDGIPGEEEVTQGVWSLKRGRAGGKSDMKVEDLKEGLREGSRDTKPVTHRWQLLVRLIQKTFRDGAVPEEVAWATMVFLPKGKAVYLGIGITKVVWKVCTTVVNCRLKRSVTLHDALHGFRSGRFTGIATLESKLVHQLEGIAHEPLFQVFLDMRKAYDSLYRGRFMEIIWVCGMGQRTARLISHHWDKRMFILKAKMFLGTPFIAER